MKHDNILKKLTSAFSSYPPFVSVLSRLNSHSGPINVSGLSSSSLLALFISSLLKKTGSCPLVVFNDKKDVENFVFDIESFIPAESIVFLPDMTEKKRDDYSHFLLNDALQKIFSKRAKIILTSIGALNIKLPSMDEIGLSSLSLKTGLAVSKKEVVDRLNSFQYTREFSVEFPGEYASRGDIVDVYSHGNRHPFRVEFYGDSIESIRIVDKESLQTLKKTDHITILPIITESTSSDSTIFSYLPENTLSVFPNYDTNGNIFQKLISSTPPFSLFTSIYINDLRSTDIHFSTKPANVKTAGFSSFKEYYISLNNSGLDGYYFLFCSDSGQQSRLSSLLDNEQIYVLDIPLSSGFELPDIHLYVFTDTEIFSKRQRPRSFSFLPTEVRHSKFDPTEIVYDDLVVHLDYGIGKYMGLQKISAFGADRECLVISYLDNDRVFVPLEKMSLVHKYRSTGNVLPRISKLGSAEWDRVKLRTKRSIEELSQKIINLYSKRLHSKGFIYSPDNEFQWTMEAEFPFEETVDQIKAIADIKKDMESSIPMDRLLCGDVGFGKTEVAVRAAFKAVSDSKQVAILTPTTILADQHYISFKKRLEKYPLKIERLSRFVKNVRQKKIIRDLSAGKVDIIIGTHRILSKDITFSDLGLLIIDEEHRFGVADKDKIKNFRADIDVLSLSATPIPRSLHFSLIGARDFSLISTPPKERLPIFTEIISFDKNIIRTAVNREIERGGQVFFVHNEIKTIASLAFSLKQLFPNLSIQYVHGQMSEDIIEPIMVDFINNEIDMLVTTAIIESGIDIPNANTIFINKAQNFGLSQLYQLRGRVGRLDRQAYAYLITSSYSKLNPNAIKRLQSIKRHTSLGSGYFISLEDLEMRGSGNVFGLEQSGNLHAIGYDLYIKILQDALAGIKEDSQPTKHPNLPALDKEVNIVFPFPAYISEDYISSESLRLSYYKQLTSYKTVAEIEALKKLITDIFGRYPTEIENLFSLITIKLLCSQLGVDKIKFETDLCRIQFSEENPFVDSVELLSYLKSAASDLRLSYKFIPSADLIFALYLNKLQKIEPVKQFLYHLWGNLNLGR